MGNKEWKRIPFSGCSPRVSWALQRQVLQPLLRDATTCHQLCLVRLLWAFTKVSPLSVVSEVTDGAWKSPN